MGQPKAILPLAGMPMICRVVKTCIESQFVSEIVVVTGHESVRIREALVTFAVTFVHNSQFETGEMLSSVQAGVRSLATNTCAFYLFPSDLASAMPTTLAALGHGMNQKMASIVHPNQGANTASGPNLRISNSRYYRAAAGRDFKTALVRYETNQPRSPFWIPVSYLISIHRKITIEQYARCRSAATRITTVARAA